MSREKSHDESNVVISLADKKKNSIKAQNKEVFGSKIKELRLRKGWNQPQLAEAIGAAKNSVANWENGTSRPEFFMITKLCRVLGISSDVFFGVEGSEFVLTAEEKELLRLYRKLDQCKRKAVSDLIAALVDSEDTLFREQCCNGFSHLVHDELPASAGTGMPLEDDSEKEYVFLRNNRNVCRADTIITVRGDSMNPTFSDGDELLVEYTPEVAVGEIGIFVMAGEGYVKEYQRDGLHSHNPEYKTIHPSPDDNFRCVGRVLGLVTKDMYPTSRELSVLNEMYSE